MTFNYYLNRNQKQRGKITIFLYIREGGQQFIIHTKEYIENRNLMPIEKAIKKYWDPKKQRVKTCYAGCLELNRYLESFKLEYQNLVREIRAAQPLISFEDLKNAVLEKTKNKAINFHNAFNEFIKDYKQAKSKKTINSYKTLYSILLQFEKEYYKLTFSNIDLDFEDKFNELMRGRAARINTKNYYLNLLIIFLNWAAKRNYHNNTKYKNFDKKNFPPDEYCEVLTENELNILIDFDFSFNLELEEARDVFVFSCLTGQRFEDVKALQFEDIKNEHWLLVAHKTKEPNRIPLLKQALAIARKYEKQGKLPIYTLTTQNKRTRAVCKAAGINEATTKVSYKTGEREVTIQAKYELISSHTARRTFITLCLRKGMSIEEVMKLSGHKSLREFQKYIKISDMQKTDAFKKAWESAGKES